MSNLQAETDPLRTERTAGETILVQRFLKYYDPYFPLCLSREKYFSKTLDDDGDPHPTIQKHFELCRGGHERHLKVWRERVIKSRRTPGEE